MQDIFQQHIPFDIDISEDKLLKKYPKAFEVLLLDQTRSKDGEPHNIFWATDDYEALGEGYEYNSPILTKYITGEHEKVIMPRVLKDKDTQRGRVKGKAEVFTPSWICNKQNNLMDDAWFEREGVFNTENNDKTWTATDGKIEFSEKKGKTWRDYVHRTCLEMTCGEAPYLVSRYDATTGEPICIKKRIGLLDRKLRVVHEYTKTPKQWFKWAYIALQSTYGFEWQGDNLLLARENLLITFVDYFHKKFDRNPNGRSLKVAAEIISWNIWQMDGLKGVIPNSCGKEPLGQNLFNEGELHFCPGCKSGDIKLHNGIKCYIMNWKTGKPVRFIDLMRKR